MFYMKLDSGMNLVITVREAIYRGDHLNRKLAFLIPTKVGDIDIGASAVYLSYIRADGTADIDLLIRRDELYNESYYEFTMPVTSRLTRYAGPVTMFLTVCSGPCNAPVIAKSGECTLHIQASTNMDEVITDGNLALIYSMHRHIEDMVARRADGIAYDEETRELQLKSGEEIIGDPVVVPGDNYMKDDDQADKPDVPDQSGGEGEDKPDAPDSEGEGVGGNENGNEQENGSTE